MSHYITLSGTITFNTQLAKSKAIEKLVPNRIVNHGDEYFLIDEIGKPIWHTPIISKNEKMTMVFSNTHIRNFNSLLLQLTGIEDTESNLSFYSVDGRTYVGSIHNGQHVKLDGTAAIISMLPTVEQIDIDALEMTPNDFENKYKNEDCHAQVIDEILMDASKKLNALQVNSIL